ncbi:3-ketoacyl-ACP reductase [Mycobacterium antarcticum]|uniref:mycofactocin-coupled SDR family oxidoreductase n=1 Tax=unclassified Mycolicibacterium TaxID=2636767 RepID=UPI002383244D|nr:MULTISPECIES: mycofactocin-coupled SDR family oxidoreductase [unclassified Mycolicibacterium]BDX33422.1 3-ketoacyl-ACP reductase [Mycolicibacterium sp. TUM20985]GLP82964.1 3-ketoacyl-ACP reductase [Mycolicibacterium sp. TUM20984]
MGLADNKVAFISGVARGQGRSHAVRLAEEGADIIGFDICANDNAVEYPLATPDDLEETASLIEKFGRKAILEVADVRDYDAVRRVVDNGVAELGRLDIVLANAGVMAITGKHRLRREAWFAGIDIMLNGVFNTVEAALPHVKAGGRGGSIVITSSTAGLTGGLSDGSPGIQGYIAAKHGVVGLMRGWANCLAPENIRVNTVHPTGVNSPMVANEAFARFVQEYPEVAGILQNPLPVPNGLLEPEDVTNSIMHLISDAGKFITGSTFTVDAGFSNRA